MRKPRGEASRARTGTAAQAGPEAAATQARVAAEQVGDVGEAVGPQGGGGDRRAVAAGAVDDGRARSGRARRGGRAAAGAGCGARPGSCRRRRPRRGCGRRRPGASGSVGQPRGQRRRRSAGGARSASSGCSASAALDVGDRADDVVEADAGEADLGLGAAPGVAERGRSAGPGRTTSPAYSAKRPSRPTLTEPAQVAGGERLRATGCRAPPRPSPASGERLVERRAAAAARGRRAARARGGWRRRRTRSRAARRSGPRSRPRRTRPRSSGARA